MKMDPSFEEVMTPIIRAYQNGGLPALKAIKGYIELLEMQKPNVHLDQALKEILADFEKNQSKD